MNEIVQPFMRHPALAKRIAKLAVTISGVSLIEWDGFLEELNAALEHPPTPGDGGWRDIASAPRDENVLLATTGGWVGEARLEMDDYEQWHWQWGNTKRLHANHKPLKWQPLPSPPQAAQEGE